MLAWGQFMKSRQQRRRQQREWILGLRMLGMQGFARVSSERRQLSSISRHHRPHPHHTPPPPPHHHHRRSSPATSLQFLVTQTQPTPAAAEKYTHRQYLSKYIWKNLRNTVLESEKYSLQNQEVHPQDSLLLALLYYYLANFSWRWRYCRKIDPQDTLLGFSFAGQLRIGGLPKNFQPLHISKYLLPNMTLLLWLNVPSCCLSNLPVVLPHTCKLDSVTVWQKNHFYIPMQGLHCSSLTKYPHIYRVFYFTGTPQKS